MTPADLSRALRASFWPHLKAIGFEVSTDRAAWRYVDDAVDVIEVRSVGADADACGCPSVSFAAVAGSDPAFMDSPPSKIVKGGRPRPRYWDCRLQVRLEKTLSQPWFEPFSAPPTPTLPASVLTHRRALQSVIRKDRHDRPDIWFVRDDGTNLDEVIEDLRHVTERVAIPGLDRLHDPCQVIELVLDGTLADPESLAGWEILEAARTRCPPAQP
jgi:hypothetical protein